MSAVALFWLGRADADADAERRLTGALRADMREGRRAVVIVPEQFTFETEQRLANALSGLLGVQVLSFERLSERVLALSGADERPFLSRQGLCMVVRRAAFLHSRELAAFGRAALLPGFAEEMTRLLRAMKQACISPDALASTLEKLPPESLLAGKLRDLLLLYRETESYLESRYLTADDAANAVLERLPASFLAGANVYLDGFPGASAQTYRIMEKLFCVCSRVTVSLTADLSEPDDLDVFAPALSAYANLARLAQAQGCTVKTVQLSGHTAVSPALAHLERNLFAYPSRVYAASAPEITVYGAADRETECEAAADAVAELARSGVRYREMAVIVSDLDAYAFPLMRALKKRGVPAFLDKKSPVRRHPAADLLLSAVSAAVNGYSAQDVLAVAKSGYADVDADGAELLENYVVRYGVRGNRFLSPFTFGDVPPEAEAARACVIAPLAALRDGLSAPTASEKARAVYDYLEACKLSDKLKAEAEVFYRAGEMSRYAEQTQVWNLLMELLSQLDAILSDVPADKKMFLSVLTAGLDGYAAGVVPGTGDQVLLGDVTRTRSRRVRALFVLGANDGMLPRARGDDALIDDRELALMAETGMATWRTAAEGAALDRFDLYSALTRVTETLRLSYAYTADGSEQAPSSLIRRVLALFPACRRESGLTDGGRLPACAETGYALLADNVRRHAAGERTSACFPALLAYYDREAGPRARKNRILHAGSLRALTAPMGEALARRLYTTRMTMSASRLEQFNRCAFAHFARYGLIARERPAHQERAADLGSFYHAALDAFVRAAEAAGGDFAHMTEADADAILERILPTLIASHNDGFFLTNERQRASLFLILEIVKQSAYAVLRQLQSGVFKPMATETRFGPDCPFPPIRIALPDGAEALLSGVIDRVDRANADGEPVCRVIDYKTGGRSFDFAGVLHGLTLQLPLYLAAVTSDGTRGVGMYYMPVIPDPVEDGEDPDDSLAESFRLKGLTLDDAKVIACTEPALDGKSRVVSGLRRNKDGTVKGALVTEDEVTRLLDAAKETAERTLARMLAGEAAVSPTERACAYCPYKSACGFDPRLPACRTRKVDKLRADAFFRLIGGQDDAVHA